MPASAAHPQPSLGGRINAATRSPHAVLNRLLIQRLPLALPPHHAAPLLLAQGLVPFARIFFFFEAEWDLLARHQLLHDDDDYSHDARLRTWLASLRPQGLTRSTRLLHDLNHLRAVAGPRVYSTVDLGDRWTRDLRMRIRSHPHVLVAFAWVFYMAIFSGGRWIRQQLVNGGAGFWAQHSMDQQRGQGAKAAHVEAPGYSFLSFDGDQDGEDIKASFKARLAEAEDLLSPEEQADVVEVAQQLFARCNALVGELDRKVMWDRMLRQMPRALCMLLIFMALAGWLARSYLAVEKWDEQYRQ